MYELLRSEEHTSELQSLTNLVCRLLLEKTNKQRDNFMQRYHHVISSFGGKTSHDADNRHALVMRSNLCASGYDVDGTEQTSLSHFSGRVQQTYKHSVARFFVPEHGSIYTLALVCFSSYADQQIQHSYPTRPFSYFFIRADPLP